MDDKVRKLHDAFAADLKAVCEKHGATCVSVCASMPDGTFYGASMVDNASMGTPMQMMECALSIARLWQHAREAIRGMLDKAERGW